MPTTFRCTDCGLMFSTGWSHLDDWSTGYGASLLLVCRECGTQHEILIAREHRGDPELVYYEVALTAVPDCARVKTMMALRSQLDLTAPEAKKSVDNLPLTLARDLPRHDAEHVADRFAAAGAEVRIGESKREPNPRHNSGPPRTDILRAAAGPAFGEFVAGSHAPLATSEVLGPRTGPMGRVVLEEQCCGHCNAKGALVGDWSEQLEGCPHCGGSSLSAVGGWVT